MFAIIDKSTGTIAARTGNKSVDINGRRLVSPPISGWEDEDYLVLEMVEDNPPYDADTQIKTGPVETIEADRVKLVWTVRDKTQQELDAEVELSKDMEVAAYDRLTFKVAFVHENRIRALEGKQPITAEQFRTALRGML